MQYSRHIPGLFAFHYTCSSDTPSALCQVFGGLDATHWLLKNDPERPSFGLIPT